MPGGELGQVRIFANRELSEHERGHIRRVRRSVERQTLLLHGESVDVAVHGGDSLRSHRQGEARIAKSAINGLVTTGDAERTATAIASSPGLWIAGIVGMLTVALLDVVAAVGFIAVFRSVNRVLSLVAGAVRAVYAVLFGIAIGQLVTALASTDVPKNALASVELFSSIWHRSLGLFGICLLMIGYLAIRSGFIPKIFGILLGLAGLGYIADFVGLSYAADFTPIFGKFGFVGETAIIFWPLIKGHRLSGSKQTLTRR